MKDEGVHKQLDSLFEALHNQYSISKLFVEGFCWGGNYALELAATDKVRLCSSRMLLSASRRATCSQLLGGATTPRNWLLPTRRGCAAHSIAVCGPHSLMDHRHSAACGSI